MAMSPRSRLLMAGVAGVVVAIGRSVVGAGVSWWMCCPVGMVEAGVVERVGSRGDGGGRDELVGDGC